MQHPGSETIRENAPRCCEDYLGQQWFPTWEDAVANAGLHGESIVFHYTVPALGETNLAAYFMEEFRAFALTSCVATSAPTGPPRIVEQPHDRTVLRGSIASLNVTLANETCTRLTDLQWLRYGAPVPGATNASLVFPNIQPTAAGIYKLLATNSFAAVTSAPATLTIGSIFLTLDCLAWVTTNQYYSSTQVTVQISSGFTNGTIFYTLDGSTPDFTSQQYTNSFVLTHSRRLRAIAYPDRAQISTRCHHRGRRHNNC